jgi:hypothetical protein
MDNLQDITCNFIRKNWLNYKDEIYNSPLNDILWENLENKFSIDSYDVYFFILKNFINDSIYLIEQTIIEQFQIIQSDDNTLIIKNLSRNERKHIHELCNKIGLHHESKSTYKKKKPNRFLYVYKPKIYLWEFSEKNPYEPKIKIETLDEELADYNCDKCKKNGKETNLYYSNYIYGLYCNKCLNKKRDHKGIKLIYHKFEPLYLLINTNKDT